MESALGRPFTLGMLYDAYHHKLIPGVTLCNETTLEEHTVESSQISSAFKIIASDSIEDKSLLLDVDSSLKASVLSGLVEVGGSAKYLNDRKKFHHQSRVTLQYKATTSFKQLSVTPLGNMDKKQRDVVAKVLATHVVTGILYGANAFFVFDTKKLEASRIQDIQGSIEALIKKTLKFDIDGEVDIKLTDKEKALMDELSCKFYGDFLLDINPVSFEMAVKTCFNLPKLLGEKGENAVPLKVWLMPLTSLDLKPSLRIFEISVGFVRKLQNALEDLHQLEKRCNDFLEHKVVKHFPKIHDKLSSFLKLCIHYKSTLQQKIAKKLPFIRTGKEGGRKLNEILEGRDKSPFSHDKLTKWMYDKEREINVVSSCVDMMEGIEIARDQSELERAALSPGVEHTLCFVFTSLETTEPYLEELADYTESEQLNISGEPPTTQDHWYFSDEVVTNMREKAKSFHDLAKALKNSRFKFFVAGIANGKYNGANIYHYKQGTLITEDFSKPDLPAVEKIKDKSALIWYARALTLDQNTAHISLTVSEGNKKATDGASSKPYEPLPQRFDGFPQVLCREGLTTRCYWELDWSSDRGDDVAVGVCYEGMSRRGKGDWCRLGGNDVSWCLGHSWFLPSEEKLYAEHNKKSCTIPSPSCGRLGVYLDWPGGTLSFYKVSSNTLSHLHTFHATFTEPVYPAFSICGKVNYVFLRM
uniref:stonustoxin subunit alpha-like n=1 Tax=Semicossyphus pulcher TaxID=241346 RepID=UPI0037E7ADFF